MDSVYSQTQNLLKGGTTLLLALLLAACAGSPYQPSEPPPRPTPPATDAPRGPVVKPPPVRTPSAPQPPATQKSHPRYAPPPHAAAHWDNRLSVYVVEGRKLYYRERLYYRWDGDWYSSGRPEGPWEPVAGPSVPPGLRQLH